MSGKKLEISVVCYFFVAVILEGLQRLSGLFVLELLESMCVNHQTASIPFIFSWVVSSIIASFSEMMVDSKKSEYVILSGVLLSAAGSASCILAKNISTLTMFWGLIFGSGHGLASPHLSKRLKNANCSSLPFILQVTSSLGVLVLSFAFTAFNSYYGLQGSCLIFCGLILNHLPLTLARAYNMKIYIPKVNWRIRKKSKQYSVSKQNENKTVSIESFSNSLEPDVIINICQNEEFEDEIMENMSQRSINVGFIPIGRKRTETRGNDLQGLDTTIFLKNKTHPQMFIEIKNYEKERELFECSFHNKDVVHDTMEDTILKAENILNCNIINNIKLLEKNILNADTESELNLKNKIPYKVYECEINKTLCETKESLKPSENYTAFPSTSIITGNMAVHQTNERSEKGIQISLSTDKSENTYKSSKGFQTLKLLNKGNIPLDIKVHVEECVFITGEEDTWEDFLSNEYLTTRKNCNTNYSNSLSLVKHKRTKPNQNFPKTFSKCSEMHKPKLSSIYSISENSETMNNSNTSEEDKYKQENNNIKSKGILIFLKRIFSSRVCLFILLIKVIFEINIVTLLTIFADFGRDIDNQNSDFKWILVAFGVGGLIGKFCCCKLSKTIPEKCHAISVVLFLLNGLATAGVLYSSNLNWLAGFYCILGALEGGIKHIIPKCISEYVDKEVHSTLPSVESFLSGVGIICIPYGIGLFRDEMGEYEFLLQILSCSSVLCAFLAYFLPVRTASNKRTNSVFRSKIGTA